MVRLIHARSGGAMWVSENRLEEYLAAGHRLAALPEIPEPTEPIKRPSARKKPAAKKEVQP